MFLNYPNPSKSFSNFKILISNLLHRKSNIKKSFHLTNDWWNHKFKTVIVSDFLLIQDLFRDCLLDDVMMSSEISLIPFRKKDDENGEIYIVCLEKKFFEFDFS